ncbi:hypothetical protein ACFQY7_17430 [Actinomadura luteofluorescens]|uniref:Uncharacterized protein n=1 Tax=Actinomadura luteofluorescens TaxID=46163 RepID=A0A7Y9EQ07_9ACTN|nr:hypothetical protein [Actinomadura luteofluorescens]NYD51825.1 hypothetical protein [Actinomadura luteofluorescens]
MIGSFSDGQQEPEVTTPKDIPDASRLRAEMVLALQRLRYQCTVLEGGVTA